MKTILKNIASVQRNKRLAIIIHNLLFARQKETNITLRTSIEY
jgi:hypothetical protein